MVTKLKIRRDNSAIWILINPVLEQGEPAVELDTGKMKIGDGERPYVELPYTSSTSTGGSTTVAWGDITGTIASNEALATALSNKEAKANKGTANGYAPLNEDAVIPGIHILKGQPNGVPSLDADGIVLREQLPPTTIPNSIPKGVIVMWSGTKATIPTGWGLCDGTNGTPNLIDRFVVGAVNAGTTGGSNNLTLTEANIPSHTHTIGSHTHTFSGPTGSTAHGHAIATTSGGVTQPNTAFPLLEVSAASTTKTYRLLNGPISTDSGSHSHSFSGTTAGASGTTGSTGNGTAIDNRPAYYALAFIIKL